MFLRGSVERGKEVHFKFSATRVFKAVLKILARNVTFINIYAEVIYPTFRKIIEYICGH